MDGDARMRAAAPEIADDFIPADYYTAPGRAADERARLWPRIWHMACREEDLPRVGDFVTYEILEESILVVRSAADDVRAFYNVCQHRGRRLRDDERGHLGGFYCRFHGWRYRLDGSLAHVPSREDWEGCPNFQEDALGLKPVRVGLWGGWVWLQMDPDAPELLDYLGEAAVRLDPFDLGALRRHWEITIHAEVNWKVVAEAFNEGYHAQATHTSGIRYRSRQPSSVFGMHGMYYSDPAPPADYLDADGRWVTPRTVLEGLVAQFRLLRRQLNAMVLEPHMAAVERLAAEASPDLAPGALMDELWRLHQSEFRARGLVWPQALTREAVARAGTSWHIFPNSLVLPTPDGALWYRLRPDRDDPRRCIFDIWSLARVPPGCEPSVERKVYGGLEAAREANAFLAEDFDNMVAVQRGMDSRGWSGARTNPVQERLVSNFHRTIERYLSGEPGR